MNEQILFGARHRVTGEWLMWRPDGLKPNPERPGVRCAHPDPGQVLANTHMHWRDAINTYRIVRIRKVRVPAPSKRLAAWKARAKEGERNVSVTSTMKEQWCAFAEQYSTPSRPYSLKREIAPTPAAAMRALVAAMGAEIDR